jgi:predicted phosphoribosyltransferase
MFKDRIEAGYALADRLKAYKNAQGVVLAVPKGAVPIGYIIANELRLPLELVLAKKIGHPTNKEYAIGAVSLWGSYIVPHENVSTSYIESETQRIRRQLEERQKKYMSGRPPLEIENKTVIIVDDGIATGNTLLATVKTIKKSHPAEIIIAVPVSSESGYQLLSKEVDKIFSILIPKYFAGVGAFYHDFGDVSEEEVKYYLDKSREEYAAEHAVPPPSI